MTRSKDIQNPDQAPKQTEELTLEQLEAVSGGALQAHLTVKGQKSGKFKGETSLGTNTASEPSSG
jgi:hypothetical protein